MKAQAAQFPIDAQSTASPGESPDQIAPISAASELNGSNVAAAKEISVNPGPAYACRNSDKNFENSNIGSPGPRFFPEQVQFQMTPLGLGSDM